MQFLLSRRTFTARHDGSQAEPGYSYVSLLKETTVCVIWVFGLIVA